MKITITLLLLILALTCAAQQVLIPYREGNLYGLSDERGNIVLAPQYDRLEWIEGAWFRTGKNAALKDSTETSPGKFSILQVPVTLNGLIHNGKIIVGDEPFDDYNIVAGQYIIARYEGGLRNLTRGLLEKHGRRSFYSLLNLRGEELHPDHFGGIQKIETAGVSSKDRKKPRYILFVATSLDNAYSMFVFDTDRQQISEWLVKDAIRLSDESHVSDKQFSFKVTDRGGVKTIKVLDFSSGKFVIRSGTAIATHTRRGNHAGKAEEARVVPGHYSENSEPALPVIAGTGQADAFNPYHALVNDTLYYWKGSNDKRRVILPPGSKIIFMEPRAVAQYQPVIVISDRHFYIVKEDKPGPVAYDSLVYFDNYFLAWKNINGQTRAGVIDAADAAVVPLAYDSLYADIRYVTLEDKTPARGYQDIRLHNPENKSAAEKARYQLVLRDADTKYNYLNANPYKRRLSELLTVYKNGKCGVISVKGDTVIPLQYDMIARNDLQLGSPRVNEFLLLRQNSRYSMARLQYNLERTRQELVPVVIPTFEYIPGFFYPDYYGIKGYKLIGLYDDQMAFKGYASADGTVFYKE